MERRLPRRMIGGDHKPSHPCTGCNATGVVIKPIDVRRPVIRETVCGKCGGVGHRRSSFEDRAAFRCSPTIGPRRRELPYLDAGFLPQPAACPAARRRKLGGRSRQHGHEPEGPPWCSVISHRTVSDDVELPGLRKPKCRTF